MACRGRALDLEVSAQFELHDGLALAFAAAAKANQSIFYNAEGHARSAAEVVKLVRERFTGQMDRYADAASTMTDQEPTNVIAPERGAIGADMRAAVAKTDKADPAKTMISHYILEEMAKLISSHPMAMSDGSETADNGDDNALPSTAFQGADWTAAMTRSLTKDGRATADQAALERGIARGRAIEANRTYEMLNAVPAVPFIPARRNDPS